MYRSTEMHVLASECNQTFAQDTPQNLPQRTGQHAGQRMPHIRARHFSRT